MTMFRFFPHQRVGFREYVRSDGTFSYFFSLDTVRELFCSAGLVEVTHTFNTFSILNVNFLSFTTFDFPIYQCSFDARVPRVKFTFKKEICVDLMHCNLTKESSITSWLQHTCCLCSFYFISSSCLAFFFLRECL